MGNSVLKNNGDHFEGQILVFLATTFFFLNLRFRGGGGVGGLVCNISQLIRGMLVSSCKYEKNITFKIDYFSTFLTSGGSMV